MPRTHKIYTVYLVNDDGRRAPVAMMRFEQGVSLKSVLHHATGRFDRFVILDEHGVQVHASDERDATGAYLPAD